MYISTLHIIAHKVYMDRWLCYATDFARYGASCWKDRLACAPFFSWLALSVDNRFSRQFEVLKKALYSNPGKQS